MEVYINMEMPKSCRYCLLRNEGDDCCLGALLTEYQKRPDDCPLVPVPPHYGRLIDADALLALCKDYSITPSDNEFCKRLEYALTKAPTIIPADPAKDGET